jgi:hypothetical protein
MLNSLLTNKYLLALIRDYVQFQFDNNTHFAAARGIKPSYSASLADALSQPVVTFIDNSPAPESNTYIFKTLLDDDKKYQDFVKSIPITTYHTLGLFSCNKDERIYRIHTGSTTSNHSNYYLPVYNKIQSSVDSYHEFDISYAHISGSGSSYIEIDGDYETEYLPSKTMYRKYMLECFEKTNGKFEFKNNKNGDHFYILQFGRDSFKDRLDPGNFQISLAAYPPFLTGSGLSLSSEQVATASKLFTLIDNSRDGNEYVSETEEIKDYYYLVSGSLQDGIYDEPESDGWGVIFPNKGIVILDATVLDNSCSLDTSVTSSDGNNPHKLFLSISSSLTPLSYNPYGSIRQNTGSFFARSMEKKIVETHFCRVMPGEMLYSNNPTYLSGIKENVKYRYFQRQGGTYITAIGLYNNNRELLAVGKLKKPLFRKNNVETRFQVRVRMN